MELNDRFRLFVLLALTGILGMVLARNSQYARIPVPNGDIKIEFLPDPPTTLRHHEDQLEHSQATPEGAPTTGRTAPLLGGKS